MGAERAKSQERAAFGRRLRELRTANGVTGSALASLTGIGRTQISRIENGWTMPSQGAVRRIAEAMNLGSDETQAILRELRSIQDPFDGDIDAGPRRSQAQLIELEAHARLVQSSATLDQLPALTQSMDCVRVVLGLFAAGLGEGWEYDLEYEILLRSRRQAELTDRGKQFEFLVSEAALACPSLSSAARHYQLAHLRHLASQPNIRVRIKPRSQAVNRDCVGFALLDDQVAAYDTPVGWVTVSAPEEVNVYSSLWQSDWRQAIPEDEALRFIDELLRSSMNIHESVASLVDVTGHELSTVN